MVKLSKSVAIAKLKSLSDRVDQLTSLSTGTPEFGKWERDTNLALLNIFGSASQHVKDFRQIGYWEQGGYDAYKIYFKGGLGKAKALLQSFAEEIQDYWEDEAPRTESNLSQPKEASLSSIRPDHAIFIGHGRSKLWARLKIFIEDDLGIKTITYESESRVGESIVPILEEMLSKASFAVLILTAEDGTADGLKRARQNVIHEAGLFQGRLGFKRAVLLRQRGLEDFSNVAGLQYIDFDGDAIEQTFYELQRVLRREGLPHSPT